MTKEERLIVTAYTGVLMVDRDEFLDYAEQLLGRPILAKEVETEEFADAIVNAVTDDFVKLCED
jgi:hypothetical protein